MIKLILLILSICLIYNPCFALKQENLGNYLRHKGHNRNYRYYDYDYE